MLFTPMRIGGIARAAYGSATAMLQGDRSGSDVMLRDLEAICEDLDEALWAIAILTLERLATAYELRPPGGGSEPMATTILARADGFGRSTLSVRAAASRLDALRSGDLEAFAASTVGLTAVASEFDLLVGAAALLTAALWWGATAAGRQPEDVCRELCTAAVLATDH
jgi:hypothetical protein